nr:hypothetical protein P5630_07050 [Bacillus subtilis]
MEKEALAGSAGHMKEGDLVDIVSESGEFLARGYYGTCKTKGSAGRLPAINMNGLTRHFFSPN